MERRKRRKSDITMSILGVLIVAAFVSSGFFIYELSKLNNAFSDLNKIEYLSSSTQRLIRLVITDNKDDRLAFYIDEQTIEALDMESSQALSVLAHEEFGPLASGVLHSWQQVLTLITAEEEDTSSLYLAADNHYYQMTDLSNSVSLYTSELNSQIVAVQSVISILLSAIGLVIFNNALRTHTELKQSKAMAQMAQIDLATGLFNRSRCQELFKHAPVLPETSKTAMMVFDLNDLKKTNDLQGHRMGDELIHAFASVLKKACTVHREAPFLGRYGGDEFIIYYENIQNEEEILAYLKELDFLTKTYNETAQNFKISYAVGYVIEDGSHEDATPRQMFERADEEMYINKHAIKKRQREELEIAKEKAQEAEKIAATKGESK